MRIKSKDMLFGHPVLRVRALLREAMRGLSVEMAQHALAIDRKAATALLEKLEVEGYIEKRDGRVGGWRTTVKGNAMAMASASAPLQRSTAQRLLIDFLERVERVRDEPKWLFKVKAAVLFGSFLGDSATLGDIDVALTMRPAYENTAAQEAAEKQCRREAEDAGRRFSNYVDYLFWPQQQVKRFLRSRRRISLHDPRSDWSIIEAGPHVAIYGDEIVIVGSIPLLETWPIS